VFRRKSRANDGAELVELVRVPPIEAEIIAAKLRDAGIEAAVFGTGFTGYGGQDFVEGGRVMVHRRDAEVAAQVIEPESSV
jgi:hypothetical protein